MGKAVLPDEPSDPVSKVRKLNPLAKAPGAAVFHTLSPADVKLLKQLISELAEYVHNDIFDRPEAAKLMQHALHEWEQEPRDSDDSGVFSLGSDSDPGAQLDREHYLFLRLNYCRWQVFKLLEQHTGRRLGAEAAAELLRWEHAVMDVRAEIARENMPLVLAMAKRTRITGVDLTDLISEGNLALLRAVNKFDCSRGYKFSTYACRAILKSFSRVATRMARYRGHFPTEFDPALEKGDSLERTRVTAEGDCVHELKAILHSESPQLSDIERKVILARFALDQPDDDPGRKAKTLEQVGNMIGVTKERVRQIQNKALSKLREALEESVLAR